MKPTILLVEDESDFREYLADLLVDQGYTLHQAGTGSQAKQIIDRVVPDLVLLDLKLPDITGETLCKQIKNDYPHTTVIMITAKDTPEDLARGLDLGADDYIPKPFSTEELIARIKARTRDKSTPDQILRIANLELDPATHQVTRNGQLIELSPQEFKLLEYFMTNPNQVLSREMILSRIWGTAADVETRVVDVYVGYLRKKIDKPFESALITSIRGFGYMLKDPAKES